MDIIRFVDRIADLPLNGNPYFETTTAPWTSLNGTATLTRDTTQKHEGTASLLVTPVGGNATVEVRAENVPATVGTSYVVQSWVRCPVSRNVSIGIIWRDSGGTLLSSALTSTGITADTWTQLTHTATAPAGTAQAMMFVSMGSTPPPSHLLYIDEATARPAAAVGTPPVTRLDLNDGSTWGVRYDGTDFSPPPLKSAWANTLLSDGERLSAAAYANRRITLSLDLMASTQDAIATELQKLWKELNRPSNFLVWEPQGATSPVFFRTIRSSNTRVTDYPSGTLRTVEVELDAEPFAYGVKETLTQVTVVDDLIASSGTGASLLGSFTVSSPKGDVETPLYLAIQGSAVVNTAANGPKTSLLAVRRRGTVDSTPAYLGAEQMTTGANAVYRRLSAYSNFQNTSNANSTFETDVSNWTATGGTFVRDTAVFQAGVASGKLTPSGTNATVSVESEKVTVTPGISYVASGQLRNAVLRSVDIGIRWYDSGSALISTTTKTYSLAAGTFTFCDWGNVAPANAATASIYIQMTGTPPASNILNIDSVEFGPAALVHVDAASLSQFNPSTVLSYTAHPTTPSVDARGTYRVFMRYAYGNSGTTATADVQLRWGDQASGNLVTNLSVALPHNGTNRMMADLGLVQIPGGYDPVYDGLSGVEIPAEGIYVELLMSDGTAGSIVHIDYLFFAPADDRLMLVKWPTSPAASTTMVLDSASGQVYCVNSGATQVETGSSSAQIAGGPPMVTPGVTNKIWFANDVSTQQTVSASRSQTTTISGYYWPRYLTVRTP